jgi:ATP-dependent DNA helicase RecG
MRSCEPRRTAEAQRREDPRIQAGLVIPEGILKCLVAFANTAGGIVVIGVEDRSKNVRGVPDVIASEEKLANLVSDSIRPRLIPDIEVVPWRNLNVLAVQVYPSNTRPHYLERLGAEEGVFIRVGSTNRKAETLQIEELKRLNWRTTFDEQAMSGRPARTLTIRTRPTSRNIQEARSLAVSPLFM